VRKIIAIAPLAAVLILGCGKQSEWDVAAAELPKARADAKAAGLAVEVADYPIRSIPDAENAAVEYQAAIREWNLMPESTRKSLQASFSGASADKNLRNRSNQILVDVRKCRKAIDLMLAGSKKPNCDFKKDVSQGYSLMFDEFATIRSLVFAMSAEAVVSGVNGNAAIAKRNLIAIQKIAVHMGQERITIPSLVSTAFSKIGARATMRVVGEGGSRYADLVAEVANSFPTLNVSDTFSFEAVSGVIAIRQGIDNLDFPGLEALKASIDKAKSEGVKNGTILKAFEARHLQYWTELAKNANDLDNEGLGVFAAHLATQQESKDATHLINVIGPGVTFDDMGSAFASLDALKRAFLTGAAIVKGGSVANATAKYKTKHEKRGTGFAVFDPEFKPISADAKPETWQFEFPFRGR